VRVISLTLNMNELYGERIRDVTRIPNTLKFWMKKECRILLLIIDHG